MPWRRAAQPPAGPDHQRILGDIGRMLRVASDEPNLDDDALVERLTTAGVPRKYAWRLVLFVPIAFGRPAVARLGVVGSESYIQRLMAPRSETAKRLRDEPEYRAAADHLADFADQRGFKEIAGRSPELHAISSALDAGEDLAGGRLLPTVVTLES